MTLLEKSGNDFDQCTLLVSLLREAAASNSAIGNVTYKYGMMTIPGTAADQRDFTRWLGFGDWLSIRTETVNGGWPYLSGADRSIFYNNDYVALARVCVEAVIGGTARLLDPSFKKHTDIAGIDIKSASGYVQSTLLTQAGGTSTAAQVSGMNPVNLGTHLGTLTNTLANSLKTAPAGGNASVLQVIGGRQISEADSADFSTAAYFAYDQVLETWSEIPGEKASTIEVTSASGLTWTTPLALLRGRRLSLTFSDTSPYKAQIWLDDVMQVDESTPSGTEITVTTSVYHPFRDLTGADTRSQSDNGLKYQRRPAITGIGSFPGSYAILYAFDPGADHVRQREEKLAGYRALGLADSTREVRTETLNLMGLQWLRQSAMAERLIDRGTNTVRMNYHRMGRIGQEAGYYVDVAVQYVSLQQRQGDLIKQRKSFELGSNVASALEHGIVEQLQHGEAVSTVDIITWALTGRGVVNRTVSGNTVKLIPAATLIPASPPANTWRGTGYAAITTDGNASNVGMIISGGYFGGFAINQAATTSTFITNNAIFSPAAVISTPITHASTFGADPVDLATGAFTYDHVDLALGGPEPRGLVFSRYYNTRLR